MANRGSLLGLCAPPPELGSAAVVCAVGEDPSSSPKGAATTRIAESAPPKTWHAFESPLGFTIHFPGPPRETALSASPAAHEVGFEGPGYRLSVTFLRLPRKLVERLSWEDNLREAIRGMTSEGNVVSSRPIAQHGLVGREVLLRERRMGAWLEVTTRVFVDGPIVVRLDVGASLGADIHAVRNAFFRSFWPKTTHEG